VHKATSDSEDKSIRCVPSSYHWFHCERAIAPPRERIKHKFDWGKKKNSEVTEGEDVEIIQDDTTNEEL
jgi:hypothetical protein